MGDLYRLNIDEKKITDKISKPMMNSLVLKRKYKANEVHEYNCTHYTIITRDDNNANVEKKVFS